MIHRHETSRARLSLMKARSPRDFDDQTREWSNANDDDGDDDDDDDDGNGESWDSVYPKWSFDGFDLWTSCIS